MTKYSLHVLVLIALFTFSTEGRAQTTYTLSATSDAEVQFSATPSNLIPDTTDPQVWLYDLGSLDALDLEQYNITSGPLLSSNTVRIVAESVDASAGGDFIFNDTGRNWRPNLEINAISTITLDDVHTFTENALQASRAGKITLTAGGDITIHGTVKASGLAAAQGGPIRITSTGGAVELKKDLDNSGRGNTLGYGGAVTISATSITAQHLESRHFGDTEGMPLSLTATAGGILTGYITTDADRRGGAVTISAEGGAIETGYINTRSRRTSASVNINGGDITVGTTHDLTAGTLDAGTTRTRMTATASSDKAGSIRLDAGTNVTVTGDIRAASAKADDFGTNTGGDIFLTASNGNIEVQGLITANALVGTKGNLTLSAPNGSITLTHLDTDQAADISITAGGDTTVLGALKGLGPHLSGTDVTRFTAVTGDIYYNSFHPGNAYLGGATYDLVATAYQLKPSPGGGPMADYALTSDSDAEIQLITDQAIDPTPAFDPITSAYVYELGLDGGSSLNLGTFDISATSLEDPALVRIRLNSLSHGGGSFDFDGAGHRPRLEIEAINTIAFNSFLSRSSTTGTGKGEGGDLTLIAPNGITVAGKIDTSGNGVSIGGSILLNSSDGVVELQGPITTLGRGETTITIKGTSVITEDISNSAHPTASVSLEPIRISSTDGGINAGFLSNAAAIDGGLIQLAATGGDIEIEGIDTRSLASGTPSRHAGSVNITSDQSVFVGSIDASVARITENANPDDGGAISIEAGGNVTVAGPINAYVSSTSTAPTASSAGSISMVSSNGDIRIEGPINADAPAGHDARGDLTLSAANGSITLDSLNGDQVRDITMIAATNTTTIMGALLGLDDDILDSAIDRFTEVTGNVYYFTNVAENVYLDGQTYPIVNSVGGTFYLMPSDVILPPVVADPTFVVASIDDQSATLGGAIVHLGGANVTERGIYWSTIADFIPPGQGTKSSAFGDYGLGLFDLSVTGLPTSTTVYFRAYATHSGGEGYSEESSFVTRPASGSGMIVDFEGVDETKGSYTAGDVTLSGLSWNLDTALIGTLTGDKKEGLRALRVYYPGAMSMNENRTNGIAYVTFLYASYGTDASATFVLEYSTDDGGTWTQAGPEFDTIGASDLTYAAVPVFKAGDVRIRFRPLTGSGSLRINVDNIEFHDFGAGEEPPIAPEPALFHAVAFAGGHIQATFQTENGVTYRLYYTTDLTASPMVWTVADSLVGTGSDGELMDTNPADPIRVYRITAE